MKLKYFDIFRKYIVCNAKLKFIFDLNTQCVLENSETETRRIFESSTIFISETEHKESLNDF